MGKIFENLTWDELCDLMCGKPEEEIYEDESVCDTYNAEKTVVCE